MIPPYLKNLTYTLTSRKNKSFESLDNDYWNIGWISLVNFDMMKRCFENVSYELDTETEQPKNKGRDMVVTQTSYLQKFGYKYT